MNEPVSPGISPGDAGFRATENEDDGTGTRCGPMVQYRRAADARLAARQGGRAARLPDAVSGLCQRRLPQAKRIAATFPASEVAVIGIHTVFEHHEAMMPVSLAAFIHEYRLGFPIAVDRPGVDGPIPHTMAAYGMRGTPSLVLIDRAGTVRHHGFGAEDDLKIGAEIALLMAEGRPTHE